MTKYFVWVETNLWPIGQIWIELFTDGNGKPKPYLAAHAIADDDKRSIEELKKDFRYEAKP